MAIELTYNVSGDTEQLIIDTMAKTHRYEETITQPILDASGNTQQDSSGNTITETIPNPIIKKDFVISVLENQIENIFVRAYDNQEIITKNNKVKDFKDNIKKDKKK